MNGWVKPVNLSVSQAVTWLALFLCQRGDYNVGIRGPAQSRIPNQAGTYGAIADALYTRIFDLIPEHPEILELKSAFDLFNIKGFDCSDLEPSYMQAAWALAKAKGLHKHGQSYIQAG